MTAPSGPAHAHPAVWLEFALPPHLAPIRDDHSVAAFAGLAAVELQLVMQCCDLSTLLALARCSRFTLRAASDPLAWRALSPLSQTFLHPLSPDAGAGRPKDSAWQRLSCCIRPPPAAPPLLLPSLAQRISGSLLRFCDIKVDWSHEEQLSNVSDAELDALAAIPRLCALNSCGRDTAGAAQLAPLVRRPELRGLTALTCGGYQLNEAVIEALEDHCPRLSTFAKWDSTWTNPPLHRLPALTDLSVQIYRGNKQTMPTVLRCAGLRRLAIRSDPLGGCASRGVHAALLSPSLRALEHLSVHDLDALHADGRDQPAAQLDWAAAFANLPALRSLHLADPRGIDELLAAVGAGCAQLHSLRAHCIEVDLGELTGVRTAFPSAASLSSLLARQPSLRSVALLLASRELFARAPSPIDERNRGAIWLSAHGDLSALAALHGQRLSVDFLFGS